LHLGVALVRDEEEVGAVVEPAVRVAELALQGRVA